MAVPVTREPVVSRVSALVQILPGRATRARPCWRSSPGGSTARAERPQLLPLELLDVELYRGRRRIGQLARLRDVLPGRYAFGLTGRGPRGARLPPGAYVAPRVGTPVGGGPPTSVDVAFRLR